MAQILKISVKGYKSIKSLLDFELRPLNVLIGANGAGKSNFISLFKLLHNLYNQNLQLYQQIQGGPDALLHFGRTTTARFSAEFLVNQLMEPNSNQEYYKSAFPGYTFSLVPTQDNHLAFERDEFFMAIDGRQALMPVAPGNGYLEAKLKDSKEAILALLKAPIRSWQVYHFHDTSETANVKRIHPSNDNLQLQPDAANLAAYLRMLHDQHPQAYRDIIQTIQLVLPQFDDFVHRAGPPEHIQLEWKQKGRPNNVFKAHILSDGSLRFICLMTLLLQPISLLPDTILIDEPELGLHPAALVILADVLKQVTEQKQLIIATQSVELINALSPEDVIIVEQEDGASTFRRCNEQELSQWLLERTNSPVKTVGKSAPTQISKNTPRPCYRESNRIGSY